MKRLIIPLFLFILLIQPSIAQKVDPLFYRFKNTYQKFYDISARFEQISMIPDFGRRKFYGKLYIKRPYKARWDYIKPTRQTIYLTKNRFIMYMPQENKVIIQRGLRDSGADLAMRLLVNMDEWKHLFNMSGAKKVGNRLQIELIPVQRRNITQVIVIINSKSLHIEKIIIGEEDGSKISFRFYNMEVNKGLRDRMFNFEPTEDMEVLEY